ncbi:peroxidase-like [Argiope bruennichi]|uniref:peroxidase-like n=1 Tax=Argiope bruennichi TaxID=94029 RepID=UPI0024949FEF|nr:peroxidase-like [Argiope bruennichi]
MIFRFLLLAGFTLLLFLTENTADKSKTIPNVKAFFYYRLLANDTLCEDMENKDCQHGSYDMNSDDGYVDSATLFLDDQTQCELKQTIRCDPLYPYRRINGSCNNLAHPTWGISRGCYLRFQPAFYHGYDNFSKSATGNPLPEPRDIVLKIFKDVPRLSTKVSFMFTIYGQTIAHDLSRAEIEDLDAECCAEPVNDPACASVPIRHNDPLYTKYNQTCLFLHRTDKCTDCSDISRQQVNGATAPLDVSTIYGSDHRKCLRVRAKDGTGKLLANVTEMGEMLPLDHQAHRLFCPSKKNCFLAGDMRVNQHVFLTSMETLFMREHNRIATRLKKLNPHWEEEKLFQEARRIVIATMQCITYKEYLPLLLGPYVMRKFDMAVTNTSDGTKYNPKIHIGVRNEFATAGFRLHSMIPSEVGSFDLKFTNVFRKPDLIVDGHLEKILKGASKVPSEEYDQYFALDVTQHSPANSKIIIGFDVASFDIQRGRDHGLAPYVVMVRFCSEGQLNIKTFDDLAPLLMPKKSAYILRENYESVEDVDLYVGLHLERKFPGSLVGPTALCMITQQFYFAKFGDRFYFEHEGEVPSFSKDQRNSLKQCSLARFLCDNSNITHVQQSPMLLPSSTNPAVPCEDVPKIDLNYWKENS